MKETKLSFKQASQICGGWLGGWLGGWRVLVWVHCSRVLTAISSGGDPQGTVRNAGSEEELREALGGQHISASQRAVMNGSGITGHQQLGGR